MLKLLAYVLIGKLIIFLAQKVFSDNYPPRRDNFLTKLFGCDLCLGFWIYFGLAFLFGIDLTYEIFDVPIVSEFIAGASVSFVMHLITIGWKARYQEIFME